MTVETYQFEYYGAPFEIAVDLASETSGETTTDPPNMRVISGTWKTWRLTVDPDVPGIAVLRLQRSIGAGGGPHPSGNLTPEQSATDGHIAMVSSSGYLYLIPTGYGAVGRLYTDAEWQQQLDTWESELGLP